MNIDEHWWILMNFDEHWWILINIDEYWWNLMNIDKYWRILMNIDDSWGWHMFEGKQMKSMWTHFWYQKIQWEMDLWGNVWGNIFFWVVLKQTKNGTWSTLMKVRYIYIFLLASKILKINCLPISTGGKTLELEQCSTVFHSAIITGSTSPLQGLIPPGTRAKRRLLRFWLVAASASEWPVEICGSWVAGENQGVNRWGFPFRHRGTPSHHPFLDGMFPCIPWYKPSIWKYPYLWKLLDVLNGHCLKFRKITPHFSQDSRALNSYVMVKFGQYAQTSLELAVSFSSLKDSLPLATNLLGAGCRS